jgi:hypothetical protein
MESLRNLFGPAARASQQVSSFWPRNMVSISRYCTLIIAATSRLGSKALRTDPCSTRAVCG